MQLIRSTLLPFALFTTELTQPVVTSPPSPARSPPRVYQSTLDPHYTTLSATRRQGEDWMLCAPSLTLLFVDLATSCRRVCMLDARFFVVEHVRACAACVA
jgi:hypothetical protein